MRIFSRQDTAQRILENKRTEQVVIALVAKARELKGKGYSNHAIARQLGVAESTARRLLKGER